MRRLFYGKLKNRHLIIIELKTKNVKTQNSQKEYIG